MKTTKLSKRGRPSIIPWNKILPQTWRARTDKEIFNWLQENYGVGTVTGVFLKRKALISEGKDVAFKGKPYTRNSRA